MGQERESTLRIAKKRIEGEALLETAEIIFRPVDGSKRLRFAFADIEKSVANFAARSYSPVRRRSSTKCGPPG